MSTNYDVIVVGTGTMGLSACWQLGRRGVRVLGLDRYAVPHAMGSHHGHTRMIRLSYFEHPDYVPLLRRAYQLWREIESSTGTTLFHQTGGLYLSPPDGVVVPGCQRASEEHGLPYENLDLAAIRERFPYFQLPDGFHGFYESVAGVLMVDAVMTSCYQLAVEQGVELRGEEPVLDWRFIDGTATVKTTQGEYTAKRLILTGGAWSRDLLSGLDVDLNVTRQTLFWLPVQPASVAHSHQLPAWFLEYTPGLGLYGFPELPGRPGFKVAEHVPGDRVTPDDVDRQVTDEDWQRVSPHVREFLPSFESSPISQEVCLYTMSPDSHFIVDRVPGMEGVSVGAGFSGHGFKFAPVIGEVLAQLALDGSTSLPIDFLSLNRFA